MRRDWRNVLIAMILFPLGAGFAFVRENIASESRAASAELVRLTLDLSWGMPRNGAVLPEGAPAGVGSAPESEFVLAVSEGRVIEALTWPPVDSGAWGTLPAANGGGPGSNGTWRLGKKPEGRVRVLIEAPLDAGLIVRGGDQVVTVPLLAIVERPQHTPALSPLTVSVERLSWDSLAIDLGGAASDGIVAPGTDVPMSLAYNILWPESTEVAVRTTAVMRSIRGGDVLWRHEPRERDIVVTNRRELPARSVSVPAPRSEGTYVLEVHSSWEPTVSREGSRLGRLIRRRKPATVTGSAVRRVVFTVVDPAVRSAVSSKKGRDGHGRETEVDSIDLNRARSYRPLAAGRSPAAEPGGFVWAVPPEALIESSRRDKLRGWIMCAGAEAAKLDAADALGLAWSAVGLKVTHPERPHRLTLKVRGGEPSALGVALIEPGGGGPVFPPRVLLDACASGPPILEDGPPATFTWLVWPSTTDMVMVLVNRSTDALVRLGTVTITELDDLPLTPPLSEPHSTAARTFGLYLSGPHALEPFGGSSTSHDPLETASNLAKYLAYCGASAVVLPEELADRSTRRALGGQADEDSTGPDRLELVRRVVSRQGSSLWLELGFDGPDALPGLPRVDSPEAARRGLVRVDRQGRPDGVTYHAASSRRARRHEASGHRSPGAHQAGLGRHRQRRRFDDSIRSGSDSAGNTRHRIGRRHVRPVRARVIQPRDCAGRSRNRRRRSRSFCGTGPVPGRCGAYALADMAVPSDRIAL